MAAEGLRVVVGLADPAVEQVAASGSRQLGVGETPDLARGSSAERLEGRFARHPHDVGQAVAVRGREVPAQVGADPPWVHGVGGEAAVGEASGELDGVEDVRREDGELLLL